jgi:hypothetical protein
MKIATSEIEHLREEVKNCHRIIKNLQEKRKFVGLTDEQFLKAARLAEAGNYLVAFQRIQQWIKEKNT